MRHCKCCNADISDKPRTHKLRYECFKVASDDFGFEYEVKDFQALRSAGDAMTTTTVTMSDDDDDDSDDSVRYCKCCHEGISGRPKSHKVCYDCFKSASGSGSQKRPRARRCEHCSSDISGRPETYKVCYDCFKSAGGGSGYDAYNCGPHSGDKRPREEDQLPSNSRSTKPNTDRAATSSQIVGIRS